MTSVDGGKPANDNLEAANNNRREYARVYMARRRAGAKSQRDLLRDGLHVVEAHAPDSPEAQTFIAAVKGLLDDRLAREGG